MTTTAGWLYVDTTPSEPVYTPTGSMLSESQVSKTPSWYCKLFTLGESTATSSLHNDKGIRTAAGATNWQPVSSKMLLQYSFESAIDGSQILKQNTLEPMKLSESTNPRVSIA